MIRNVFDRGCLGKIQYKSSADATKAMRGVLRRAGAVGGIKSTVYFCEKCEGYHFGRSESRKPKAVRSRRIFSCTGGSLTTGDGAL